MGDKYTRETELPECFKCGGTLAEYNIENIEWAEVYKTYKCINCSSHIFLE